MKHMMGICLAVMLSACATANSSRSSATASATAAAGLSPVAHSPFPPSTDDLRTVKDLADQFSREGTLVVFDIDDTLLTTEKLADGSRAFYGGDRWYLWQKALDKASPYKVGGCLIDLTIYNYRVLPMVATQADATEIVRDVRSDKLLLTSRGPANWESTMRELHSAGYSDIAPTVSTETFNFMYTEDKRTDAVMFRDGVMMTSGFNKGQMLLEILALSGKTYTNVILVDDTQEHIEKMKTALEGRIKFHGTRYTGIKDDGKHADGSSKLPVVTEAQAQSHVSGYLAMMTLLAQMSPSTFQRFESGCPKAQTMTSPSL